MLDGIFENGHPIEAIPLRIEDEQLGILDDFADVRMVGLGEATHGTREFFQMKHRVFKYLVERHGYSAFLFEMDMAEARIFNDWVQLRTGGDIKQLMQEKMIFWTSKAGNVSSP